MKKAGDTTSKNLKIKVKRKGVHSKKKNSGMKKSKNYVKRYRGQGK
jgi:hypothetical protein